ncbi:MAG TPA: NAD(P)/FAD-dependent oxidoreductase [Acidobacteriaceae bacterium]|jgi:protoporphyrinogen oxidase|nr:NAD(P)/FAD-dependent oxidoreductase [Acidobacteriaceae bacterium]
MKTALIIGAGPAGLTAALELLRRTDVRPIVLEATGRIGGISCTIRHNGNRMDIGGHRFFSKSDRVMDWWTELMPVAADSSGSGTTGSHNISYQGKTRSVAARAATAPDLVMLVRPRKSRIYFLRSFFDYPVALNGRTIRQLGPVRMMKIGLGYLRAKLFPRRNEKTLEDFLINRFGTELYLTFFKSYTEKVWGVPCDQISAEWGAQRIKGLSLRTAIAHFLNKSFSRKKSSGISQKDTETSLIERFLYPKYGPGQLWEHVAALVTNKGGEVRLGWRVDRLHVENDRVVAVHATDPHGATHTFPADYVFSTMPVRDLIHALDVEVPAAVRAVADGLLYRDFITVGLLVDRLAVTEPDGSPLQDTWIYIQEPDVMVGRLQIFNNWSPFMVGDPSKIWIGLEYFCYDTDPLWKMSDEEMARFAIAEIEKIGILRAADVRDTHVVRVPKTYPAYFGTYDRFDEIVRYTDRFQNLFLVGRNGMHKYNNQDHSMLTAMTAVDQIAAGKIDKSVLWQINTEQEYHEVKK